VEIAFTYPNRKTTGDHYDVFRCPLKFSQPLAKISFDIADARRPFTATNRALAISGDEILEDMINDLKGSDIISQVKLSITENLPSGTPSKNEIAKQVFLSVRTLHRRLADEGTNFRTLVLEVRKELAEKYVANKEMPLAEVSYMLGFTDISSFFRSFKQWTGVSPSSFRDTIPA
jgi:AraC-like DNA-binding protein